jgi:hypothetical protein
MREMAKQKPQAEKEDEQLSAKRELFCRYCTQNSELFGNATLPKKLPTKPSRAVLLRRGTRCSDAEACRETVEGAGVTTQG